jgi:Na+/proline symporter
MGTRVLGDGVRLFATAIPLRVIGLALGVDVPYAALIAGIALLTLAYTWAGGLKAVVWVDVAQFGLYVAGALMTVGAALWLTPDWGARLGDAVAAGKLDLIDWGSGPWSGRLAQPYALPVAVLGGAAFSMASHGTDQLIVQRLLACRSLAESRRALVWSGVGVVLQFALFLGVGLALWMHYGGAAPAALGLQRADEVFPLFIVEELPAGVRGLLLAGIVAAAMSTLSSSLSALASSTVGDLLRERWSGEASLRASRLSTLLWGAVLAAFALLIQDNESAVVELGLGIAGFTYGPLLGAFALALMGPRIGARAALAGFAGSLVLMGFVVLGVGYAEVEGAWRFLMSPSDAEVAAFGWRPLAWPLYPAVGAALAVGVGWAWAQVDREGSPARPSP